MPRRSPGVLLPLELAILDAALAPRGSDGPEFHGFHIAKQLLEADASRRLTAHGTLYKALTRLERAGLLTSRWEEPEAALAGGRPRRRLYTVTGEGERAAAAPQPRTSQSARLRPGLASR